MRGTQRKMRVAQHFTGQKNHIRFACLDDLISLLGSRNQTNRAGQYAGFLTNLFSKLNLVGAAIEGVSEEKFKEIAEGAKANCIVSRALSVPITLSIQYS